MATGQPFSRVLKVGLESGAYVEGKGCKNEQTILCDLGLRYEFENGRPKIDCDFICSYRPYDRSAESFRDQAWGRRAIFTVPSLTTTDGHHAVYWDGRRVLDPNPEGKKRYSAFAELLPSEIVLFNEVLA